METDKGAINQLEEVEGEKENAEQHPEEVWVEAWSDQYGWVQALENKRPRQDDNDDDPEAKVRKGDGKASNGGKGKGKNGGKGGKGKSKGTCWQCGSPDHYQRDCPKGGKGKGAVFPAAWASWRPTPAWPTPTSAQWRSWIPRQGKGGKGK